MRPQPSRRALLLVPALLAAVACSSAGAGGDATNGAGGAGGGASCALTAPAWGLGGEHMLPGTDCLGCHALGHTAHDHPFSAAGTVFRSETCPEGVAGATVHLADATTTVDVVTNEVGNFATTAVLVPPLAVSVEVDGVVTQMNTSAPSGACGACHSSAGGPGWVFGG